MSRSVLGFLGACFGLVAASVAGGAAENEQVDLLLVKAAEHRAPDGLSLRVRLKAITPAEPTEIRWRYGGEGQGGEVVRGVFPKSGAAAEGQTLAIGEWSAPVVVTSLVRGRFPGKFFLTVTAGSPGRVVDRLTREIDGQSTGVVFEFEFSYQGKVVKAFSEEGPDGGTATIVIPAFRLVGDVTPQSPQFTDELTGVLSYAVSRAEYLEKLPWAAGPLPRRFAMVNNVGGYGKGFGYGIRTSNQAVTLSELRSLRQLGTNGFRDPPEILWQQLLRGAPEMRSWSRCTELGTMGFPVPRHQAGRKPVAEAGCPFGEGVAARTREAIQNSLDEILSFPLDEVWALTVDEIGCVFDHSPEGKAHPASCPRCAAAFRDWLKAKGLQPAEFGKSDWAQVRPLDLTDPEKKRPWLSDPGTALAAYYSRDFYNYATAKLFTPLRDAFATANGAKRRAMQSGGRESKAARQPWVYSFALRGNTFLMKGHSLDFFDFYRQSDNAIVYETSNREPRIWGWDSYLCDVQRVVGQKLHIARGIYIKPHRGAPVQRMLAGVSRGNQMIYWYTYGPDYKKGDSFSQSREVLALTSKAAHLLGKAEDTLYAAEWTVPAEIAVVKPETTQRWMNLSGDPPHLTAAWENAKWVYTALQHAHLPVDPIDEHILAHEDLSKYKVIYLSGSHVTRAAAEGLRRYVHSGGTLYTSGWGLARDEANQPLDVLQPVLGLKRRGEPEMWYRVQLYGATALEGYDDQRAQLAPVPAGGRVKGEGMFAGELPLRIGREVLQPVESAEVLARFADGSAAALRHRYGKGQVYVVGLFPGLEYSAPVRAPAYNMRRDFQATGRNFVAGPALALTKPVVDASDALVEGVLLRSADGRRRCVTLANWAYAVTAVREAARGRAAPVASHLPIENLKVAIRGAGKVARATSCALDRPLPFTEDDRTVTITLPRLEEGDVVLLE